MNKINEVWIAPPVKQVLSAKKIRIPATTSYPGIGETIVLMGNEVDGKIHIENAKDVWIDLDTFIEAFKMLYPGGNNNG